MDLTAHIAYISPNGATAKVASALADQLTEENIETIVTDLSQSGQRDALVRSMAAGKPTCLFIGSPVYRDMAVPPVMALINALPQTTNGWAVPFATFGKACSGVALWQMAAALAEKGFSIAGAAKVVAVHSMMWQAAPPEGEGHPDGDDLARVRALAKDLATRFASGQPATMPLKALDYQPEELAAECKAKLEKPWMIVPKTVDPEACTACGTCADQCPAGAIVLNPGPEFGPECFDCFNCIRLCPEEAISPAVPMAEIHDRIRKRVRAIDERPLTRIFTA